MSKRPKIVSLVLNTFENDNRVLKEALTLQREVGDVTVVALQRNGLDEFGEVDGIKIHRIKLSTVGLPSSSIFWLVKFFEFYRKVSKQYGDVDVLHCHDFEPFVIGCKIKKRNPSIKLIYDCHELESERDGMSPRRKKFTRNFEKKNIHQANAVITVGDEIAKFYQEQFAVVAPTVIYNTPHRLEDHEVKDFKELFKIPQEEKVFLYQGGLVKGRGVEVLLETFEQRKDNGCHLVLMGYGSLSTIVKEFASRSQNIHYKDKVPYREMLQYTRSADYGFVSTQNTCLNHYYCMPNKLFEYVQAEVPIITNNLVDCKKFVLSNKVGLVIDTFNVEGVSAVVEQALKVDVEEIRNNLRKAKGKYCWENEELKLIELYRSIH